MRKISPKFYESDDVVSVARSLLGKVICTYINGQLTKGRIVETEAYSYLEKGCHAYKHKQTKRTAPMFENGGRAYVYLCYGIHALFNIVTNKEGVAEAVLIRAIEPVDGIEEMLLRRPVAKTEHVGAGPGKLTKALNISLDHNRLNLNDNIIWIEDVDNLVESQIVATTRIGIAYAEEDALLPWRFYIKGNICISKK
jgi:DNA-3-methyladenine glycosylase